MEEVVISLLAPVAPRRVARWVEAQVDVLRLEGRAMGVRLGRLVRATPSQGGDWLIEVERDAGDTPLEEDLALGLILTDLAALGLRPWLLVITRDPSARRVRGAHSPRTDTSRRQPVRHTRPACRSSRTG